MSTYCNLESADSSVGEMVIYPGTSFSAPEVGASWLRNQIRQIPQALRNTHQQKHIKTTMGARNFSPGHDWPSLLDGWLSLPDRQGGAESSFLGCEHSGNLPMMRLLLLAREI